MAELGHLPTIYQLVYTLDGRVLGRRTLVQHTGITESTVRTHLNKLNASGWVTMAKGGTALTPSARSAFSTLFERVPQVSVLKLKDLALDRHNAAAWIRNVKDAFHESWRYRDAAVREGATGALLLMHRADGWGLSDDKRPLAQQNPNDADHLQHVFAAQPGDGAVIVFGSTARAAQRGLWRILVDLFPIPTQKEEGVRQ